MKATLLAFLPIALLASCSKNTTTAQGPVTPHPNPNVPNPYGIPGQNEVGQYTPDATPYQPVQPINPPASYPPGVATPPPISTQPVAPPATPAAGALSHTVVPGDSLWGLSRKYGVSVDAIRQANSMASDDSIIRTGQALQIPGR